MSASEAAVAQTETTYTYQRADGSVETASSPEEVFSRCKYLGEMALLEPDKASILLELAAVRSPQKPESEPEEVESEEEQPDEHEGLKLLTSTVKTEKFELFKTEDTPVPAEEPKELQPVPQLQSQTYLTITATDKPPQKAVVNKVQTRLQSRSTARPIIGSEMKTTASIASKPEIPNFVIPPEPAPPTETLTRVATINRPTKTLKDSVSPVMETFTAMATFEQPEVITKSAKRENQAESKPRLVDEIFVEAKVNMAQKTNSIKIDKQAVFPAQTAENLPSQLYLDDLLEDAPDFNIQPTFQLDSDSSDLWQEWFELPLEVEATFKKLKQLEFSAYQSTEQGPIDELAEATDAGLRVEHYTEALQIFVAEVESLKQQSPDIDVQRFGEQPLGQTLAQLAVVIEAGPRNEILIQLPQIKEQIERTLDFFDIDQTSPEAKHQLSPEMVRSLLELLRTLGYHNPEQALIEFAQVNSLGFLSHALRFLRQLSQDDQNQEFLASSSRQVLNDETVSVRVGKHLFRLLFKDALESVYAPTA